MAVRIKDWMIPYTWWIGIEITDNHVINVLLRAMNNLIMVNEDRELYVDLQLEDWIEPTDDFPVGVTTGKILQEDWWQESWIILNWKTTSWDYVRLIYANDNKLYYDPWTGDWIEIVSKTTVEELLWDINTKTFFLTGNTWADNIAQAQAAVDWYLDWKEPIISFDNKIFLLSAVVGDPLAQLQFFSKVATTSAGYNVTYIWQRVWQINVSGWTVTSISFDALSNVWSFLDTETNYNTAYTPQYDWSPATKKYVDDWLALKQDILTPWTRITIDANNVISADISGIFIYKWNVADPTALPSSWQTVWDCWVSESDDLMYAWDWTQWNQIWWTTIDLTNYFNKTVDDSDDIRQWSLHLFVSQSEKNTWNNKQNTIVAGNNITIDNDGVTINAIDTTYTAWDWIDITGTVISNTAPFDPENEWTLAQILKKTSEGYRRADETGLVKSVNGRIWDVFVDEFDPENAGTTGQILKKTDNGYKRAQESSAPVKSVNWKIWIVTVDEFDPENSWSAWQVLKKTSTGYKRANESWGWWGWWGWNFYPENTGTEWQVLTKTSSGYEWETPQLPSGDNNVKFWTIESNNMDSVLEAEIMDWVTQDENNGAILNDVYTNDVFIYHHTTTVGNYTSIIFLGKKRISEVHDSENWDYTTGHEQRLTIGTNWETYSTIVDYNPDPTTSTNYLSVEWSGYDTPYMPTQAYQPATKQYVDSVAAWTVSVWAITNNTTGTTSTVTQVRAGTRAEYNSLWSHSSTTIYYILD